jgi:hypothetical protein
MNTQTQEALKQLIDKHKGERTFYDHEPLGVYFTMGHLEAFYKEALEQPAQEPVAWMRKIDNVIQRITLNKIQINDIPLYTHPAQPWRGLTDDEIARLVLINEVDKSGDTGFARLIEQALRDKNT